MQTEYSVYDRRTGELVHQSIQPDASASSENAAIRESGVKPSHFAEVVTREVDDDVCRPYVGRKPA